MKEAFFYYTTILTLESISYWISCCEQTLGNQQIQEGRVGFAQTPGEKSILTGTHACRSLLVSQNPIRNHREGIPGIKKGVYETSSLVILFSQPTPPPEGSTTFHKSTTINQSTHTA